MALAQRTVLCVDTSAPLCYRGYVYDQETGLYYLQSRYYDPEIGRFLNADALVSTGQGILGNNMFAYCRNNPVKRKDVSGTDDICVTDGDDDNPLNDVWYSSGGGAGGGRYSNGATRQNADIANTTNKGHVSSDYSAAQKFLQGKVENPNEVLNCFSGPPTVQTLTNDTTVYRVWGGTTAEIGHWVSPENYGMEARELLSLPPGNTMAQTSSFLVPAGTTVITGIAAPYFGHMGGGMQWWIARLC